MIYLTGHIVALASRDIIMLSFIALWAVELHIFAFLSQHIHGLHCVFILVFNVLHLVLILSEAKNVYGQG